MKWSDVILNSNWKSSIFHVLPKVHKSKSIRRLQKKLMKANYTFLNVQPPEDLTGIPAMGGPNSPTQDISVILEKTLISIVSRLKTYIKDD